MKKRITIPAIIFSLIINAYSTQTGYTNEEKVIETEIKSVTLYQNQAKIERGVRISLSTGNNTVILRGLPEALLDWSVRGSFQPDFKGKITSLEVETKALVEKRRRVVLDIERRLDELREEDRVHVDHLKDIESREKFLNSISDFTGETAAKELQTRIPRTEVWDDTLVYVSEKRRALLAEKRKVEKERDRLGREIQKLEFELSQVAGSEYLKNYLAISDTRMAGRSSMEIQRFSDTAGNYSQVQRFLKTPQAGIDKEKQLVLNIFSPEKADAEFSFTYMIARTRWNMLYDLRVDSSKGSLEIAVYGNIYQQTGEDWKDVYLYLSTGAPAVSITPPALRPWFLDLKKPARPVSAPRRTMEAAVMTEAPETEDTIGEYLPEIDEKGPYLEIKIPYKQTIISSTRYQKKFIREFTVKEPGKADFFYKLIPATGKNAVMMAEFTNNTPLPWLAGESQVFLDNEFSGRVNMPLTPAGGEVEAALAAEDRITGVKELVGKFEDSSGLFSGSRRITLSYQLSLENHHPRSREIMVYDRIPVSKHEKIRVELKNLSEKFHGDPDFENSSDYRRGIRCWKVTLDSGEKREISYDIVVTFDRDLEIDGLP